LDAAAIDALIGQRQAAKLAKDFAEADRIRQQLAAMGVELKDSAGGTSWVAAGHKS
jgi:cysteinyl-tRNA synthetase